LLDPQQGLPPLPGAADEARAVATSLRAAGIRTKLLLHDKATESAFRAAATGACIVHLACHAVLRPQASESPLFLAPQPPDDGLLLPSEIGDLQLNGALVVLAACQSGLGRATADGVVGLGRAFLQAGARCVLLSLWRVSDAATQQLMTQFYAQLVGTPEAPALDAAAALAAAQRSSRADSGDVAALWGPWLLVGDGGWRLQS
ncbi:MAG: CHAT domain-containing protein, partial [Chitinophagaceae bacterium]|nr:CHAT domain-containing protein [Rubrivivax sp.]